LLYRVLHCAPSNSLRLRLSYHRGDSCASSRTHAQSGSSIARRRLRPAQVHAIDHARKRPVENRGSNLWVLASILSNSGASRRPPSALRRHRPAHRRSVNQHRRVTPPIPPNLLSMPPDLARRWGLDRHRSGPHSGGNFACLNNQIGRRSGGVTNRAVSHRRASLRTAGCIDRCNFR
jgi:hypothetical protein